jgi:hypothetical protein
MIRPVSLLRIPRAPRPRSLWVALAFVLVGAGSSERSVRLARVEGALSSLQQDAAALARDAKRVVLNQHFHGMSQLAGDAFLVHRQVLSARLAVDYLAEPESQGTGHGSP